MDMGKVCIALLVVGLILFVAGWLMLIQGINVKVCSYSIQIPREFRGVLNPRYTDWYYWQNTVVNLSNLDVKANTVQTVPFFVKDALGYIYVFIEGTPAKEDYTGYLSIVDRATNETVVYTTLSPIESAYGRGLNITQFFMKSLEPGNYTLFLSLNTDAHIDRLAIYGPSSREVEVQGVEITLEPTETYTSVDIKYVCGVDFAQALISSIVIGIAISLIAASAIITIYSARQRVRVSQISVKKRKR